MTKTIFSKKGRGVVLIFSVEGCFLPKIGQNRYKTPKNAYFGKSFSKKTLNAKFGLLTQFFSTIFFVPSNICPNKLFLDFGRNRPSRPISTGQESQKQRFLKKMQKFLWPISGRIWPENRQIQNFWQVGPHTFQKSIYCQGL